MARSKPARGWRAQLAVGRVFELKRKTYRGNPVCVLITDVPERWTNYPCCTQVDARGCVDESYGDRARSYVGSLRPNDFTGRLVAQRRPDLERFDGRDIALIRYGIPMFFGGQLQKHSYGPALIPHLPAIQWTVFYARCDYMDVFTVRDEVEHLFAGDWHFSTTTDGRYSDPDRRRITAWLTTKTDPWALRAIYRALSRRVPIERRTVTVKARDCGDHYLIGPEGDGGPAVSSHWSGTICKKTGDTGFSVWGY